MDSSPHPVAISPQEGAAWDQHLQLERKTSGWTLMQRAGTEPADLIQSINPQNLTVFLCGPGNNGADGLVAASLLASHSVQPLSRSKPTKSFSKST